MNILLKRILKYIEQKFLRKTNMDNDPLCYKSLRNISDKRGIDVVFIFLNITKIIMHYHYSLYLTQGTIFRHFTTTNSIVATFKELQQLQHMYTSP